jgi:hypothetical protein
VRTAYSGYCQHSGGRHCQMPCHLSPLSLLFLTVF